MSNNKLISKETKNYELMHQHNNSVRLIKNTKFNVLWQHLPNRAQQTRRILPFSRQPKLYTQLFFSSISSFLCIFNGMPIFMEIVGQNTVEIEIKVIMYA